MNAHVAVRTTAFDADLAQLTGPLGFRVDAIFPADAPATAIVSGHGVTLRLEAGDIDQPVTVYLTGSTDQTLTGSLSREVVLPGGSRFVTLSAVEGSAAEGYELPDNKPSLTVAHDRSESDANFGVGRAGMRYRDLVPDRWGGRFIASHIVIPDGGPVPDYVHFHKIRFQLIFVKAGWVRVVYEDQGDPFVMHAGDAVLQPPEIRHRVLEASPGLEVIEVGTPSFHETIADWSMELPNGIGDPNRRWSGQAFVRHVAADAEYHPWHVAGWESRDTGIGVATDGLADVRVARPRHNAAHGSTGPIEHDDEFLLLVALSGSADITTPEGKVVLDNGSSIAIPPSVPITLDGSSRDCELLEVAVHGTP